MIRIKNNNTSRVTGHASRAEKKMRETRDARCETIVAVDTGGTFTDFYLVDDTQIRTHKVLSTPKDPSIAILKGLKEMGFVAGEIIHGSTVATNALLEHKGACIALVTSAGFEDVIEIGRQNRQELYNIFTKPIAPLVKKQDRFGIRERMDSSGKILNFINKTDIKKVTRTIKGSRIQAIAICLLNAYANPKHENEIAAILNRLDLPLSLSSRICPEFREFERTSTTCANAYLSPIMSHYLRRLQKKVSQPIRIMQSNGGSLTVGEATEESIRTLLSGPAGGALGALRSGLASGYDRILAFDMGGTSTDLTLIDRGLELTSESVLGGYPIKTPMIRIHTIGAGGGSIARIDVGGALQVGPESAGASPGPIGYGLGGKECTITDAHIYLGRIHPDYFLGGTMKLTPNKVTQPMRQLSKKMNLGMNETADGIIQVANANMARALRVISLERGYDPRQFTLVAFGGAGGLHACELAETLEIPRVLVPVSPGILSAFGMAHTDWVRDYVQTILLSEKKATSLRLNRELNRLKKKAKQEASRSGHSPHQLIYKAELDVRYQGQSYELRIPLTTKYRQAFHRAHQKQFGYTHRGYALEVVNVRLQARYPLKYRQKPESLLPQKRKQPKPADQRQLYWQKKFWKSSLYEREQLAVHSVIRGPAIIAEYSATTFVPPGWNLKCDKNGNLIISQK